MKKVIIYTISLLTTLTLAGCSAQKFTNNYNSLSVAMSGNKPPKHFKVENLQTMRDYIFDMKDYMIAMPSAKKEDFSIFDGWQGSTNYNKEITFYLGSVKLGYPYHITISTSRVSDYTERDKAIDTHDLAYLKAGFNKYQPDTKINIAKHGKENYDCVILTYTKDNGNIIKKGMSYRCYKFNLEKTKAKHVMIGLTHSELKKKSSKLKFQNENYSYKDLKSRAKRTLDSLYIKDGWDD